MKVPDRDNMIALGFEFPPRDGLFGVGGEREGGNNLPLLFKVNSRLI